MKKLSRKGKTFLLLILIALSLLSLASAYRLPSPTAEIAFRRKEAAQMVGPAQILGTMNTPYSNYHHTMIGRSEYGYTLFRWSDDSPNGWNQGELFYYKKSGSLTVLSPAWESGIFRQDTAIPILAFSELPRAAYAVISLTVTFTDITAVYTLETQFTPNGYALFIFDTDCMSQENLFVLQRILDSSSPAAGFALAEVTVYDYQGNSIDSVKTDLSRP